MLSILIPVYAFDVRQFVQQLHAQALQLDCSWEIILVDDASPQAWHDLNKVLQDLPNVQYKQLEKNAGRSKIRNILAGMATYKYLLFLDCDGLVEHAAFLRNYAQKLDGNTVLYGGRTYVATKPTNPKLHLHWYYGQKRETSTAAERSKQAYHGFMTNNFSIPKAIFDQIKFEEKLVQYGHEDTLFGLMLKKAGIPIHHFDNPVRHIGIEDGEEWLLKQEKAIQNLYWLQTVVPEIETRALKTWRRLRKLGVMKIAYPILRVVVPNFINNLKFSSFPKFIYLDFLKLYWLEKADRDS